MCNHCQCLHIPGFLHLLSNTIQGIFLQEFMALDLHLSINSTIKAVSSSTNSKHLCKSQHFYVTMSNQKQLSLTFNSLPSDVWLALAKFQTFQGRLLIYKNNSRTFCVLKFMTISRPAFNSRPEREPWYIANIAQHTNWAVHQHWSPFAGLLQSLGCQWRHFESMRTGRFDEAFV